MVICSSGIFFILVDGELPSNDAFKEFTFFINAHAKKHPFAWVGSRKAAETQGSKVDGSAGRADGYLTKAPKQRQPHPSWPFRSHLLHSIYWWLFPTSLTQVFKIVQVPDEYCTTSPCRRGICVESHDPGLGKIVKNLHYNSLSV